MSDSNTSNPQDNQGDDSPQLSKYELLTAYLDNEISDPDEAAAIEKSIQSDPELYNRFIFEKLAKERLKKSFTKAETPLYVRLKVSEGIEDYIRRASGKNTPTTTIPNTVTSALSGRDQSSPIIESHVHHERQNLLRYLIYGAGVFVFLIASIYLFSGMFDSGPELASNDLVEVSRKMFKSCDGKSNVQIKTNNAKELTDSMNKYLDFSVYIPEEAKAELLGGTCNEMNGEKLAHIIHRRGNSIIYTLQGNKNHVMGTSGKIILCDEFSEKVINGNNWFTCLKEKNAVAVIWFKDDVICSTVSDMDPNDLKDVFLASSK